MINFRLTDEMNPENAARIMDCLGEPRLWIPTEEDYGPLHGKWLEKIEHRLINAPERRTRRPGGSPRHQANNCRYQDN